MTRSASTLTGTLNPADPPDNTSRPAASGIRTPPSPTSGASTRSHGLIFSWCVKRARSAIRSGLCHTTIRRLTAKPTMQMIANIQASYQSHRRETRSGRKGRRTMYTSTGITTRGEIFIRGSFIVHREKPHCAAGMDKNGSDEFFTREYLMRVSKP